MERYDAILEQLKQAQRRGMDTISNRIDFVVQSLDELIQDAKTSVQEALPQTAGECLPIDDVEEALRSLRDEAEAEHHRATNLEARINQLEGAAESTQPGANLELLRSMDGARSQSELLKELLPAISAHAARAVVLVLREGTVSAWSGIGFADGERLRAWQGDAAESSAIATLLLERSCPVSFAPDDDAFFATWLADEDKPSEILLIPVVLRGKLMGAVYVDRLEGHPWSPDTAQSLVTLVCWLIDTLQFRPTAAPSLAEPRPIAAAIETAESHEEAAEKSVSDPHAVTAAIPSEELPEAEHEEPVTEEQNPEFAAVATEEPPEVEESADTSAEEQPVADEIDPSATVKIDLSDIGSAQEPAVDDATTEAVVDSGFAHETFEPDEPTSPPVEAGISSESFEPEETAEPEFEPAEREFDEGPVADQASDESEAGTEAIPSEVQMPVTPPEDIEDHAPEDEPEPDAVDEPESRSSQFLDEPPPVRPVQPPPEEPAEEMTEDEAQQEEARRFARLLVSEIKLYNEEQVERGRESKDLYDRLKEDIDRSREMFDKRISEEIRQKQDFFQDELVRILADGDPDALGT